jgi:hypothetical protein
MSLQSFYFKLIFTSTTKWYDINVYDTVKNVIATLTPVICNDFGLNYCEFVLTGQNVIPSENGLALNAEDESLFISKCGETRFTSIYIRPYAHVPSLCSICQEIAGQSVTPYQCTHTYCAECNVNCIAHYIIRCAICRSL